MTRALALSVAVVSFAILAGGCSSSDIVVGLDAGGPFGTGGSSGGPSTGPGGGGRGGQMGGGGGRGDHADAASPDPGQHRDGGQGGRGNRGDGGRPPRMRPDAADQGGSDAGNRGGRQRPDAAPVEACPAGAAGMTCSTAGAVCSATSDAGRPQLCLCRQDAAGMLAWRCLLR